MKFGLATTIICMSAISARSAAHPAQTAPSKDQWGENFNSPRTKLTIKELGRAFVTDRTVVTYNLFVTGLPKSEHYTLWFRDVGGEPQAEADGYINEEGKVVNVLSDPAHHIAEDPINLKLFGGKGQPFRFGLVSDDGQSRVFAEIIPFPMETTSGACHLSAVETGPYYSGVFIGVSGLQPDEELNVEVRSGSEGGLTKAKADDQGNYRSLVLPQVLGMRQGKVRFDLSSKSCTIGIGFSWGEGSYQFQ